MKGPRDRKRSVIQGPIFIYSGSQIGRQSISKQINEAESEYMNMDPLNYRSSADPLNYRSSAVPATRNLETKYNLFQNFSFFTPAECVVESCCKDCRRKIF